MNYFRPAPPIPDTPERAATDLYRYWRTWLRELRDRDPATWWHAQERFEVIYHQQEEPVHA